ncbi:hypothetical protein AB432_003795 [Brevibacillus brevis]|uniref:SLH domain-containing protein n=1 Tax=Brevibacillus brevis TaxID=1393 RepID=A0A2Z4MCK7_BREBE|nr:hypothetical protein [Brevibacillus brevis]AWX54214.1 hypothetical protein AB432_003795 [Brevibacillus brevis]
MISWADVNEKDWFFNEVMEASNYLMADGEPFIQGIAYGSFESNAPYLYEEQKGSTGQKVFTLAAKLTPSADNPLFVYIDGTQTLFKEIRPNQTDPNKTDVELYYAPSANSVVAFSSFGKPALDRFGKPIPPNSSSFAYPNKRLDNGDTYFYNPFSRQFNEYLYAYGRSFKRIDVPEEEWKSTPAQDLAKKYIGLKQDVYMVSPAPGATIYLPYNLNGVQLRFIYNSYENGALFMRGGYFSVKSPGVWRNDRFFPNAYINRAEAFLLIDRLRRSFYQRFTDSQPPTQRLDESHTAYEGQRVFRLNGTYPLGKGLLAVKVDGKVVSSSDYQEFDDHTVLFNMPLTAGKNVHFFYVKEMSTRFEDVGREKYMYNSNTGEKIALNGGMAGSKPSWWAPSVLSMEDERFGNGDYLIEGIAINNFVDGAAVVNHMYEVSSSNAEEKEKWFMPYSLLTRAQAVSFLNRFRKWSLERFK